MCIISPTKKGIDKLPKVGTYYKLLKKSNRSVYRDFRYPNNKIIDIPECKQAYETSHYRYGKRLLIAGGHFFRDYKSAVNFRNTGQIIAKFIIKREDITHIGWTWDYKKNPTVLAKRAKRIR